MLMGNKSKKDFVINILDLQFSDAQESLKLMFPCQCLLEFLFGFNVNEAYRDILDGYLDKLSVLLMNMF